MINKYNTIQIKLMKTWKFFWWKKWFKFNRRNCFNTFN